MLTGNFDATILLEQPPDFTFEDGLFYITDCVGGLVIRRCLRPRTFFQAIALAASVSREYTSAKGGAEIVPLHAARP